MFTFVLLVHKYQINSVDGIDVMWQRSEDTRYGVERKKRFTSKIVGRYYVVVHNGEQDHSRLVTTLVH